MIERFVAKEKAEAEFRRGRGTTDIEAARIWKGMPENIRQLPLGNAFCPNCGVTSFASGYSRLLQLARAVSLSRPGETALVVCDIFWRGTP